MPVEPQRMLGDLRALAELTGTERGARRVAWTETWAKAREWERGLLAELPVTVESTRRETNGRRSRATRPRP